MNIVIPMSAEEAGVGEGGAGVFSVGDGSRFRHSVLENGVHFFTSSSPGLHLEMSKKTYWQQHYLLSLYLYLISR